MNIVIPTHPKDFHWNIDFLISFKENCLDKDKVTITFILTNENESKLFLDQINNSSLNDLNVNAIDLKYLCEYVDKDKDVLNRTIFNTKYPLISLKKMYGCFYVNNDCIVLDSENICVNNFYFEEIFKKLKNKYISYSSVDDPFDSLFSLEIEVIDSSADILKSDNRNWFFQKTYWFFEIEHLKNMFNYIKEKNQLDSLTTFLGQKVFFDYQLYCNYLYDNKLKQFKTSYETISSKKKLSKTYKDYIDSGKLSGNCPLGFQYICGILNDDCVDEYIDYLKEEQEQIVKIHWMSEENKNKIIREANIAIGSLHCV